MVQSTPAIQSPSDPPLQSIVENGDVNARTLKKPLQDAKLPKLINFVERDVKVRYAGWIRKQE